ncbi:MAG: YggS family pyridoxal phosphate-dependent enzyme [Alloprevotella sp.]
MIHLKEVRDVLPESVRLVAVSKYHPAEAIREAYDQGQRIFGESRVQELREKQTALPDDIEWHFIGHLQPNKVKYIAPFIRLIHAVDSFKLLCEIDKQARKAGRVIDCLLELHLAAEATKFGFTKEECLAMLEEGAWRELRNVRITGLMCMASHTDDEARIRRDFHEAALLFDEVKSRFFADEPSFCQRSWGMSGDYPIAIEERATLVRIGSAIFGEREG